MTLPALAAWAKMPRILSLWSTSIIFAVAVMLPLLIHMAVNIGQSFTAARLEAESARMDAATRTAVNIETHLAVIAHAVRAASASASLARGELGTYVGELRLMVSALGVRSATLYDGQGAIIARTEASTAPPIPVEQLAAASANLLGLADIGPRPEEVRALAITAPAALPQGGRGWLAFEIAPQLFGTLGLARLLDQDEVLTVRDRAGRLFWRTYAHDVGEPLPASMAGALASAGGAGVFRNISILTKEARTLAFTHAAGGALFITSSMPSRDLYASLPLGPVGTVALAVASIAGSVALALFFSRILVGAFRRAALGQDTNGIGLAEAEALGAEVRADRQSLLGTLSCVALLEMHWHGGGPAARVAIHPSPQFRSLMHPGGGELGSAEAIVDLFDPRDQPALAAALADATTKGGTFSLVVRTCKAQNPPSWFRLIGVGTLARDGQAGRLILTLEDITQAHLAASERAVNEKRLQMATDAAELGIWELEVATGRRYFSNRLWRMIGMEPREGGLTRDETLALVHPDDRAPFLDLNALISEPLSECHYRAVLPTRGIRHWSVTTTVMRDDDGRPTHVIGLISDVTRQKETELEVRSHASQLALAAEIADIGVWERDQPDGQMRWIKKPSVFARLQEGRSFSFQLDLMSIIHEGDRDRLRRDWGTVDLAAIEARMYAPDGTPLDTSPRQEIVFRGVMMNGDIRHIQATRVFLRGPSGRISRTIGVFADITERLMREREIAEREARFRLAIDAADLGMFTIDLPTGALERSDRMLQMLGWPVTPEERHRPYDVPSLHPDDAAKVLADREAWVRGGAQGRHRATYRVWHRDGSIRHLEVLQLAERDPEGQPVRIVAAVRDQTEMHLAAQALQDSEARMRLAVEAADIGVFEYDVETGDGYWSDRAWRMRGLEPRDGILAPEKVMALVHPDDLARTQHTVDIRAAQSDGTSHEHEFRVVWADGTIRHILSRSLTRRGADGQGVKVIGVNIDITERILATRRIERSEARFRLAIETANLGVWDYDPATDETVWSPRMWEIRGLEASAEPVPLDAIAATTHPDDRTWITDEILSQRAGQHRGLVEREYRVVHPDGSVRIVLSKSITIHDAAGRLQQVIGVNQDITAQRSVEQALRDNAVRFELATKAAGLAVWEWDVPSRARHWSPEMWIMRGRPPRTEPPDEAEALSMVHPADRAEAQRSHDRVIANPGAPAEYEYRVVHPGGTVRHLNMRTTPLRDAAGNVVRVTGVGMDVTDRRLATQALQESESFFRLASEAAALGVWDQDQLTGEVRWSQRMWTIHGLEPRAAPPSRQEFETLVHKDDLQDVQSLLARLRADPESQVGKVEFRVMWPDGSTRYLDMRAMSVHDEERVLRRIIGVVIDFTEAQELRAQATVAGNVATLGQLAGGIAHELAQPLQAMIAAAEACSLRLSRPDDAGAVDYARDRLVWIAGQAARAGRTIQHLLAFSRGTSTSGVTRLSDAVAGSLELVGRNLSQAMVTVAVDVPQELPLVLGGLVEVEQVLVNLLLNARDALAERGNRRVEIRAAGREDKVVLTVADTGGGIPPPIISRIFDPFFTTKPAGKGTGLGLAISQKTMIAIGGSIAVRNTETGAEFTLVFQALKELG